jgi:hypothetical protein
VLLSRYYIKNIRGGKKIPVTGKEIFLINSYYLYAARMYNALLKLNFSNIFKAKVKKHKAGKKGLYAILAY